MRIAILADIHGNLAAFESALEHVARQHVDRIILAGDIVVGAPDSQACWDLARSLGCPMIRGNHERYVATYGTPTAPETWTTEQFAPIRWAVAQLTPAARAAMGALPLLYRASELPDFLLVHGSLRNDRDTVAAYTPEEQLAAMFPDVRERVIVRAHNHAGQVRLWNDQLIVTAGAVGLPLDGNPTAQYLLLERRAADWRVLHQAVPYDVAATVRRFETTGYLADAGPMAQLYQREVATASHHVVPFLRAYARWTEHEPVSLATAVRRFLELAA